MVLVGGSRKIVIKVFDIVTIRDLERKIDWEVKVERKEGERIKMTIQKDENSSIYESLSLEYKQKISKIVSSIVREKISLKDPIKFEWYLVAEKKPIFEADILFSTLGNRVYAGRYIMSTDKNSPVFQDLKKRISRVNVIKWCYY